MHDLKGVELRSTARADGKLVLELVDSKVSPPDDEELIVRVEATPINPSDLGLLLGPADIGSLSVAGTDERPVVMFDIPPRRLEAIGMRIGQSLTVGNEGAGTVIGAGSSVKSMIGKKVGMRGGGMYAQYRKIGAKEVIELPEGATAADGAAMFVNPLTALAFVEVMRMRGHKAIVHTAAASNLGQMLQRICIADGIPLINIVRTAPQVDLLKALGADRVLDSTAENFSENLVRMIADTEATLAFDAVGGGRLGGEILAAMEKASVNASQAYNRYGSGRFKQLYIYGGLDLAPTTFLRGSLGFDWSIGGFLLPSALQTFAQDRVESMRRRVRDEITTTFASHYTRTISLREMLTAEAIRTYERKATGEKFLVNPAL